MVLKLNLQYIFKEELVKTIGNYLCPAPIFLLLVVSHSVSLF